jgi:multidrug efflux pump subunit AcrA (membrane-fusion protein)
MTRVNRRRLTIGVTALVAIAAGGSWLRGRASAEVVTVESGAVGERIVARAVVIPVDGVAEVRARVDGRVERVSVREGQSVKAGDELALIEPEIIASEVDRRKAELESLRSLAKSVQQGARPEEQSAAEAELRAASEELALAETRAGREKKLVDKGVSPLSSGDEADRAVAIARAKVDAARARVALSRAGGRSSEVRSADARVAAARAAVDQARFELDKTRLVAPIDGVLLARRIDPGDTITGTSAGVGAPAFEIADASHTELRMEVEEVDSSRLVPGLAVKVTLPGGPDAIGRGTVTRVGAQLERRTIGAHDARERGEGWVRAAWLDVSWTEDRNMPLGQRLEVIVDLPPRQVSARVPRSAVRIADGRVSIDVAWSLGFRETPVELGAADDVFVEVRGVSPGARVRARR